MRFGWPSVTYLILVYIYFLRLYPVPLALVITTEVVLVFNSAWFSSYKPKAKWTNSLARTIWYRVTSLGYHMTTAVPPYVVPGIYQLPVHQYEQLKINSTRTRRVEARRKGGRTSSTSRDYVISVSVLVLRYVWVCAGTNKDNNSNSNSNN